MTDWQTIETAPRDGTIILVLIPYEPTIFAYPQCVDVGFWEGDWFRFHGDDGPDDIQPTHWAPLPAPPSA